jgi:uncharacterized protein DUF5619
MRNVHIDYRGSALNYQSASLLAKNVARDNHMQDPTIMAWHQHSRPMPAYYKGANPDTWWEKYGEGNGGRLEISVGEDYQFVMMDTRGYETQGEVPLRNLSDGHGNQYLCHISGLAKDSSVPTLEACALLDGWLADQY